MKENIFSKKSLTFSGNKKDPALLTVAKLIAEPMDSPRGVSQSWQVLCVSLGLLFTETTRLIILII